MRAFRILTAISAILAAVSAPAQIVQGPPVTITITGNLSQIAGSPQPYGGLSIQLQNCPGPVAITGYSVIVQQTLQLRADASGVIAASIWPNDEINCNGTTGQSMYALIPVVNGVPSQTPQCYQVTAAQGIWNLNTQQPIACTQTPPNPQDAQYRNVNVTGCLSIQGGACGGPTAGGVTKIIAGTNVSLSPSGGTGDVTINAAGGGGGGMVYPAAGVPQSTGSAWDVSKAIQGSDSKLLSASVISGTPASPLCTDALGGATTAGCPSGSGLPAAPGPGVVYQINPTTTRVAAGSDISTLFGYTPLSQIANLSDLASPLAALKNIFSGAALTSIPLIGTDSLGNPIGTSIGTGLTYSPTAGAGSIVTLTASMVAPSVAAAPGVYSLTITGGGGSGAAATVTVIRVSYSHGGFINVIAGTAITNPGAGYSSIPTITSADISPGEATFSATLGIGGLLTTSDVIPQVGTPTVGHAACIKAAGPPVVIGYCSTQPDAGGVCTCN